MRLKEVDLELEFIRVGPVVVALTEGDVFGTGVDSCVNNAAYGAVVFAVLIFGLVDGLDDVGVFLGVFADDGGGAIGRGIVVNDGLEGEGRLLHQKAVHALSQKRLVIINRATNRY